MPASVQGVVYRARDTKLDRDVAIKVLPEEFAKDEERLARFEREAKLLASLNHPNIASIYGIEASDGVKALVLELVEGPTLAERIRGGPIPVEETLAISRQITEALEAGHKAGVVHRDLKPANVKVREDGTVKVLDYGLAKALEDVALPGGADENLSQSPTLTRHGTQVGVILGTAAYMSPEQVKGKRVDKRTYIFAFGAVLYEMLTGKRAFAGETATETLVAVLRADPDWKILPEDTPSPARRVLKACLQKDADERMHDFADVRLVMKGRFEPPSDHAVIRAGLAPAVALLGSLGMSLLVGVASWMLKPDPPRPVTRTVARVPNTSLSVGSGTVRSRSPPTEIEFSIPPMPITKE